MAVDERLIKIDKLKEKKEEVRILKQKEKERSWKRGRANRYFSVRGGYQAVLRMIANGSAAAAFGLSGGFDAAHTTLLRWERCFRAALLAGFRDYLIRVYMELDAISRSGQMASSSM